MHLHLVTKVYFPSQKQVCDTGHAESSQHSAISSQPVGLLA
jgi:hypothetical protein